MNSAQCGNILLFFLVAIISIIFIFPAFCQPPQSILIQGSIQAPQGGPLTGDRAYRLRFYDAQTAGSQLGTDIAGTTTLSPTGRFNIEIVPAAQVLDASQPWYEIAIDSNSTPDGAINEPDDVFTNRVKMHSVPFALRSESTTTPATLWSADGSNVYLPEGFVGIGTQPASALDVVGNGEFAGSVVVKAVTDTIRASMFEGPSGNGVIGTQGNNGSDNAFMDSLTNFPDHGWFGVMDADGNTQARMFVDGNAQGVVSIEDNQGNTKAIMEVFQEGDGLLASLGTNGSDNVRMASNGNNLEYGLLEVADNEGEARAQLFVRGDVDDPTKNPRGELVTFGPNGNSNVRITNTEGYNNMGYVEVDDNNGNLRASMFADSDGLGQINIRDKNGNVKAGMYIANNGDGVVFGTTNFNVLSKPGKPGQEIAYTSLQGPEVAMYYRGVATLEQGRGTIALPEHFVSLASPGTITVQLTPGSLSSKGLAFEQINEDNIAIGELYSGTGSYDVHFVVFALREGYEDYKPVVAAKQFKASAAKAASTPTATRKPSRQSSKQPGRRSSGSVTR